MATGKKRKRTSLPRLTVLSMSRQELARWSQASEQIAGLAHLMIGLMTRLDACVTRLEKRTATAHRAHATRQANAANNGEQPVIEGGNQ